MASRLAFPVLVVLVLAIAAVAGACGGDDDASASGASDGGLIDSFLLESSADTNTSPGFENARLTLVNAAHDLGPQASIGGNATLRLCFGTGASRQDMVVPPLTPTPDFLMEHTATLFPGVDQGRGLTLPDLALPLAERVLWPILISARAIANAALFGNEDVPINTSGRKPCDRLVGPTASTTLQENVEYWVLPPIAPFTLQPQHAYILALTGCAGNATTANPGKCGPGFVPNQGGLGNLALRVIETGPQPSAGVRFLHLSPAANAYLAQSNERAAIEPGFADNSGGIPDGSFVPIAGIDPPLFALGALMPALTTHPFVAFSRKLLTVGPLTSAIGDVAIASGLGDHPYVAGGSYVFVAVGDPGGDETPLQTQIPLDAGGQTTAPNSRYFHFLGFPSSP